ncbi:unnamed protein product [Rotaria magnacalcarata]|uniref:Metallo-beta-lactamase domain-containing protein n=5 Tax=Rotaria magnacalcarata TaxID=392030 RepID=A0A816MK35_9BILA|nr:unnamed protein product [Rotaria magnacalcarata]CAF1988809.1 unnamed protein product [Rotaria magnacalcarata]CAF4026054.1 unnamed protein product [Rotaria magnacalcarata]
MFPVPTSSSSELFCSNDILSWKFPKTLGCYTLIGRSRADDATSLFIPELDILFGCGCSVTATRPLHIFITHTHLDHCLDITRLWSKIRIPQVYIPISAVQPMKDYIRKCQVLTMVKEIDPDPAQWIPSHELIGVKPDDLLDFRKTMKIHVFEMDYSVPCCGYGFYERRQKLEKEYEHLSSKDIGKMKRENKNLELSEERIVPLFVFMGDTTISIFNRYENELFQFPLIIVECSYIDSELHKEPVSEGKHIIWDDLQPFVIKYPNVIFVLIHFSHQYKSAEIRDFFQKLNLPNVIPFI